MMGGGCRLCLFVTVGLVSAMFKVRDSGKCEQECKKAEKPFKGFDCKTACFMKEAMDQQCEKSGGGGDIFHQFCTHTHSDGSTHGSHICKA